MERERRSELRQPRTPGGGVVALTVVVAISIVVAAIWVMGPDARPGSMRVAPQSTALSAIVAPDELEERTIYHWDPGSGDMTALLSAPGLSDPELSPDGERVVYERDPHGDDWPQIYLLDPAGVERRLTARAWGAFDPAWSTDGRIAFAASRDGGPRTDTDIYVMDGDGGPAQRLVGTPEEDGEPHWSPDGSRIAFESRSSTDQGRIWVASIRTGTLRPLVAQRAWSATEPAWSPDGRWVAYRRDSRGTLNGEVYRGLWRIRADGTRNELVWGGWGSPMFSKPTWSPNGRLVLHEQEIRQAGRRTVGAIEIRTGSVRPLITSTLGGWWIEFEPSWSKEGILLVRPSADPILEEPSVLAAFRGPVVDASITTTAKGCELDTRADRIRPGRLTLQLVNGSPFEAFFTVVRLRGTIRDLRASHPGFLFSRPRVASLYPATVDVLSITATEPGRWAVLCHVDGSSNGFIIVPVGVAGPLVVGPRDPAAGT